MQNAAKYAEAREVRVRLTNGAGDLRFEVTDDGRGFDPATTSYGTGLQGIADRLAAVGGELIVTSAPGDGTGRRREHPHRGGAAVNKRALAWTIFAIDIASLLVAGWFAWVTRNASSTSGAAAVRTGFLAGLLFASRSCRSPSSVS